MKLLLLAIFSFMLSMSVYALDTTNNAESVLEQNIAESLTDDPMDQCHSWTSGAVSTVVPNSVSRSDILPRSGVNSPHPVA